MALKIVERDPEYEYLFDSDAYRSFDPDHPQNKEIVRELKEDSFPTKKYFCSIK